MAREQIQMSNVEEQPDLLKPHDRVESNTAVRPNDSGISMWKLFKYADSFDLWLMAFGAVGAITDGMTMPLMRLLVVSNLIDTVGNFGSASAGDFRRIINMYTLRLLYISIVAFFGAFLEAFCWARTSEKQASRMRINYLKAVLRQGEGFFDTQRTTTAEVVTCVTNDTLVIQDVLAEKLPNFVMNTSLFFSSYFVAFYLTWRLALASFPFVIMLIIPGIMYGRILVGTSRKFTEAYNIAGNIAEQALSSIRTVFAFVGEDRTMAKFSDALNGTVKLGLKQGLVKGLAVGSGGVTFGIWAFNSWYGSRLVMYHGASGGRIFAASSCILMGSLALGTALPNIRYFSEARVACKRIFEMVDREPIIDWEDAKGEILKEVSGKVEFRNVEFAYPTRPESKIFRSFCLTIPANKTVALVGRSESGKSTAVALIERFYDPLAGEILLDGVNTKTLQLKWLRSQIGLVSREPALFATSIKENILFGKEGASMDHVIAAAKSSNAHDFISQLPDGYDTQVGERGVQMSGGQKQRIAIARVMLKGPRLLLLDEATSTLDAESERIVQNVLDKTSVGRTTIVVAHCLSTIRNADMIAVVQSGHVIETGMHEDLICKPNGAYAALVKLQLAAADKPDERFEGTTMLDNSLVTRSSSIYTRSSSNASVSTHRELVHEEKLATAASFRQLFLLNAPEWRRALLGCSGALGSGAVQPVFPLFLGATVFVFFLQDHEQIKSSIEYYSFRFVAVGVMSFSANMLQHYNFAAMGEHLTKRVRERMLSKILTFEIGWFDNEENSSGAVCSRLATDVNVVRSLVRDRISLLVETSAAVVIAFSMALIIAWRLAVVMIVVQPIIALCFYTKRVLLKAMSQKAIKAQDQGSQLAAEAVANHRTISAFSLQGKILSLFEKNQEEPRREIIKQSLFAGFALGTSQCITLSITALNFWYGGQLVSKGEITSKACFQIFFILITTGKGLAEAGTISSGIAKGSNAVKSVFGILDRESRINPEDERGEKADKIEGNVELRNVDFAYPSRPDVMVFKNFCLRIKAGKNMALVGQSGSGKSTIIGLIERFYDPLKGAVKIDGIDIRGFSLKSLRNHIGLVGQEPTLFGGSIRDNILYGKENASEVEMIEAAKAANAHDFISSLEKGYETNCGDRGMQLAGGQKQRIAIARAIIKNPSILLLDEATSALDSQSEKIVQEALDRIMVGRTSIVIAHRLTTIQNADSIVVIEDGKVIEQGSHSYLMSKGKGNPYHSLVSIQLGYH